MKKLIQIGETFTVKTQGITNTFRREPDHAAPMFECERIQVTHLKSSMDSKLRPYTFGTEPEWFKQRGLEVAINAQK